jgi:hypothetical protein
MALKRRLQDEDVAQQLILGSDPDVHVSDDISPRHLKGRQNRHKLQGLDRHFAVRTSGTCDEQIYSELNAVRQNEATHIKGTHYHWEV